MAQLNDLTWYKATAGVQPFTMDPVVDISTWSIVFTMRRNQEDAAVVLQKNCSIADGPNGVFNLTLAKADTDTLAAGTYFYDVQRTNVGSEDVLSIGTFTILQEVRIP